MTWNWQQPDAQPGKTGCPFLAQFHRTGRASVPQRAAAFPNQPILRVPHVSPLRHGFAATFEQINEADPEWWQGNRMNGRVAE